MTHRIRRKGHTPHARNSSRAARRGCRPRLEQLEDRRLLSFFGAPIPLFAGQNPVVADFNGDGRQDLAVTTSDSSNLNGTVNVLLNNGMGGFAPALSYPVGNYPASLVAGDFNGDGRPDLALVAGSSSGLSVVILLNHGDGTFAPAVTSTALTLPWDSTSMVVGNFFGGGNQDLAVASGNGTISVLRNDGHANFTPAGSYAVAAYSGSGGALVAGDFTGEGRTDLAFPSYNYASSGNVGVLLNQGNGTFAPPSSLPASGVVGYLAVGDFNGDGRQDLVEAYGYGGLAVQLSNGDGTFAPRVQISESGFFTFMNTSVVVGDFNGDGKLDILCDAWGGYASGSHTDSFVVPGNGDGTFPTPLPVNPSVSAQAVMDFNGDGLPDLVASGSILLNTSQHPATGPAGVGTFDPATGTWYLRNDVSPGAPDAGQFPYGGAGWLPVVGDWDGNGTTTVGVIDPGSATWYLRNSNSPGGPDAATPFPYGLPGWVPVVGDWNGTGHTGIGMFDPATGTWYLRNEDGPGAPDAGVFQYGGAGWIPVVGDWTGSGRTTIGVVDPSTMTWYLRNSNSSGGPDIAPFPYGGIGWKPVVGDWTGGGITTVGVIDPTGVWYPRNSNSPGAPDFAPFPYGLGSWVPVGGSWAIPASIGSPRAADGRVLPQPLNGSSASLGVALEIPAAGMAAAPASSGSPLPSAAVVPAPEGGRGVLAGTSEPPSRPAAVRQALLAGQARTAALDELFAAGL
jgi:hypothetical protein